MGLEFSSHSLQNFKEFYSTGVEKSTSAASVLASSALNQSMSGSEKMEQQSDE